MRSSQYSSAWSAIFNDRLNTGSWSSLGWLTNYCCAGGHWRLTHQRYCDENPFIILWSWDEWWYCQPLYNDINIKLNTVHLYTLSSCVHQGVGHLPCLGAVRWYCPLIGWELVTWNNSGLWLAELLNQGADSSGSDSMKLSSRSQATGAGLI